MPHLCATLPLPTDRCFIIIITGTEPRNLAVEAELTQKTIILLSKNWKAFQILPIIKLLARFRNPFRSPPGLLWGFK